MKVKIPYPPLAGASASSCHNKCWEDSGDEPRVEVAAVVVVVLGAHVGGRIAQSGTNTVVVVVVVVGAGAVRDRPVSRTVADAVADADAAAAAVEDFAAGETVADEV